MTEIPLCKDEATFKKLVEKAGRYNFFDFLYSCHSSL